MRNLFLLAALLISPAAHAWGEKLADCTTSKGEPITIARKVGEDVFDSRFATALFTWEQNNGTTTKARVYYNDKQSIDITNFEGNDWQNISYRVVLSDKGAEEDFPDENNSEERGGAFRQITKVAYRGTLLVNGASVDDQMSCFGYEYFFNY